MSIPRRFSISAAAPRRAMSAVALGLLAACSGKSAPPPPPPVDVTVIEMQPREATITIDYVAETEALNTVEIRPRVGGLLERQVATDGAKVRKGEVLFELDREPYEQALAQARATLAQARAAQEQAQRDLARAQPLSAIDAVSKQELDAAVARNDAASASVQAAQAQVRTAELNLGYTTIRSPIDGTVGRAQLKVGGVVTAFSTLLSTVYSTDPMYVNFSISEQRLLQLERERGSALDQNNPTAKAFKIVLADGSVYPEPAKLNFVDPAVDQRTATLPVRLTVPNPKGLLRAGQFARVVVTAQKLDDALLVPQRAVQDLQGKNFLWIVDAEGKAQQRDVVMGPRVGADWLVQSGLNPGDLVVVDGVQKLKTGRAVKPEKLPPATGAAAPVADTSKDAKASGEAKPPQAPAAKAGATP